MPEHTGNSGPTIFNPSSFHYEQIRGGWHFLSLGKPSVLHREHRVTLVTSKRLEAQALVCLAFPSTSSQSLPCLSLTRLTVNKRHLRRLPWLAIQASCKNHQFVQLFYWQESWALPILPTSSHSDFVGPMTFLLRMILLSSNYKTFSPSDFSNPRSAFLPWRAWHLFYKDILSFGILYWGAWHLLLKDILSIRFCETSHVSDL